MLLVYGENLSDAKISVQQPGVHISKIELEADGKHAFVWLNLDDAKPGTVTLNIKTASGETTASLLLSAALGAGRENFKGSPAMMLFT